MKILIDYPTWIGDAVVAQSLLIFLKQKFPDCVIGVLIPAYLSSLFNLIPQADRLHQIQYRRGKLDLLYKFLFAKNISNMDYNLAILLRNSFKSALIPYFARIKERVGYAGECRSILLTKALKKEVNHSIVEKFLYLGGRKVEEQYSYPNFSFEKLFLSYVASKFEISKKKKILILCPGAEYGESKRWPVEHYSQCALQMLKSNWDVYILGSEKDAALACEINNFCFGRCKNLAGKTSLYEACGILHLSDVVVSNDSGLMHMAAASGSSVVALYGSTSDAFAPPLTDKARSIYLKLSCSPCRNRKCKYGHHNCMKNISCEMVVEKINKLCRV